MYFDLTSDGLCRPYTKLNSDRQSAGEFQKWQELRQVRDVEKGRHEDLAAVINNIKIWLNRDGTGEGR